MLSFKLENRERYNKKQLYGTLQLRNAGFLRAQRSWMHKKRFLEQYELLYVQKGVLHLALNSRSLDIQENQLFICQPYSTLRGLRESENDVEFFWVDFQTNDMGAAHVVSELLTIVSSTRLIQRLEELVASFRRNQPGKEIAEAQLLLILDDLRSNLAGHNDAARALAERTMHYIENNLSQPLTAESIAEELSYDKDYLGRVIKQVYGQPLKQVVNRRKLESAKMLLRSSSYSIGEIGDMIGYSDPNLFTKFFLYHVNMPPSKYRKLSI